MSKILPLLFILGACQATVAKPTNFIQILTDDQGWGDLGCYGHKLIKSPHIDKLAADGLKFTHSYSSAGVCSPARAAILTGRTPFRAGVYHWIHDKHSLHLPASEITIPQVLRQNGYQTAHFGKWHLSYYANDPHTFGGDLAEPKQPTMKHYGYDYWYGTGNVARPSHKNPENFFRNGKSVGQLQGFAAQIVATDVDRWLAEDHQADKPFFMTVWLHEPHGPINTDPRFMDLYGPEYDTKLKQYLGNITQIDEAVGAIVKSIEKAGLTENTLIWYASDNGPAGAGDNNPKTNHRGSTGGLRGRKSYTYDGGIRVPAVIKWPTGIKNPGRTSDVPNVGHDMFPTILDIAGLPLPQDRVIDGTSILPLLQDGPFERKLPLYWRNGKEDMRVAIREGDWKLLCDSKRTTWELYNLIDDPNETKDMSKSQPELFERMKATLIAYDNEVLRDEHDWWKRGPWKKNFPAEIVKE